MKYGREEYLSDLENPTMPHVQSRTRFQEFYDELGRDPIQTKQKCELERLNFVVPKGNIIELGCHIGFNLIYYARKGYNIVGVDVSTVLLAEAARLVSLENNDTQARIQLITGFIEDLDLDPIFETVLLLETLEHVIDPEPIVAKAASMLAPGGKLYISAPSERVGTFSHVRGLPAEEAVRLCERSGLSIETAYQHDWRGSYQNTYPIARK